MLRNSAIKMLPTSGSTSTGSRSADVSSCVALCMYECYSMKYFLFASSMTLVIKPIQDIPDVSDPINGTMGHKSRMHKTVESNSWNCRNYA